MNESFTITSEQIRQLDKEYDINYCIHYLLKTKLMVGGSATIDEAIDELSGKTRFADEVKNEFMKKHFPLTAALNDIN